MTEENLIKSSARVKDVGEVFTPKRIVDFMLNQPEIKEKVNDLSATFLEPSAGEGAFLVEILKCKLKVALKQSNSVKQFGDNCLLALSTLYGIELMEDNMEMLVMNMNDQFQNSYYHGLRKLAPDKSEWKLADKKVLSSAKTIIRANMAQGNALTYLNSDNQPIVFSEWKVTGNKRGYSWVQRTEYTFESIVEGAETPLSASAEHYEQMDLDLFADEETQDNESKTKKYAPCRFVDVYLQKLNDME